MREERFCMPHLLTLAPWLYGFTLTTHITAVTLSVSLFAARGLGVALRQTWPMQKFWRWTSVWIDVVLMAAGLSLWGMLQFNPIRDEWLGVKLILLLVYIVLGSYGLKRAKTYRGRVLFSILALGCALTMVSIALAHHPLGWLLPLSRA